MPNTILMSGASGLIGTALTRAFTANQLQVLRLVRHESQHSDEIHWNPNASMPPEDLSRIENVSAVIHLSGANLSSHRWTEAYRQEIVRSRVETTRALSGLLGKLKTPPRSLLCASAVGIYGSRGEEILTESSPAGRGFLADTCLAWEAEADRAAEAGIRVTHLRFGVVLARQGGALRKMLPISRAGLGGRLGSGRQWMSWIALHDLVRAVLYILHNDSLQGPVNLTAPLPVTNTEFTKALGRALHRPAILPVPAFALRAAFGPMADAALLASTRAIPQRLTASGFQFDFPEIDRALRSVLLR
jgi:hypothetical protein